MRDNSLQRLMFVEYIDFDAFPEQQQLIFCYVSPYEKNKIPEVVQYFNACVSGESQQTGQLRMPETYHQITPPTGTAIGLNSTHTQRRLNKEVVDDETDDEISPSPKTTMIQSIASAVEETKIQTSFMSTNAQFTSRRVEQLRGYSDTYVQILGQKGIIFFGLECAWI